MKHDVDPFDRLLDDGRIRDIADDQINPIGDRLQIRPMARAQVVQHAHPIPSLDERLNQMGSDESSAAGNENGPHVI